MPFGDSYFLTAALSRWAPQLRSGPEVAKGMHRAGALLATTQSSNLVSWPAGRPVPHASAATRGRATVSLERPRSPALMPKGAQTFDSGAHLLADRGHVGAYCPPWVPGLRRATAKWTTQASPGPSLLSHPAHTQARTSGPLRVRASRPRAPGIYIFPSLGARGSRLHLNEVQGARGDLHVSDRPEMEPPKTRSGRRPRPRSLLHLFILLNKNINRVRRAPKRGGGKEKPSSTDASIWPQHPLVSKWLLF